MTKRKPRWSKRKEFHELMEIGYALGWDIIHVTEPSLVTQIHVDQFEARLNEAEAYLLKKGWTYEAMLKEQAENQTCPECWQDLP